MIYRNALVLFVLSAVLFIGLLIVETPAFVFIICTFILALDIFAIVYILLVNKKYVKNFTFRNVFQKSK